MFERLAALAQRRRVLIVVMSVVFFGVAGALGSGVADRLDPYGADDPDTETVAPTSASRRPATARTA